MTQKYYKYYPEDFRKPDVRVIHMDLDFDLFDTYTKVKSELHIESKISDLNSVSLNASNLKIISVSSPDCDLQYAYDEESKLLNIQFDRTFNKSEKLVINTETICCPTNHILEGLYFDVTPNGSPPQQITQCQQWGFQRIVPCIDDMTAKCTYKTTIRADSRYTNMISNGNISEPRTKILDIYGNETGRDIIVYEKVETPMAPYLFFLGVGTYDTYVKQFEYPDGSSFDLELLVFPGSLKRSAESSLSILSDAVMWVYLFTGPESYKDLEIRRQIFDLIKLREHLKYNLSSSFSGPGDLDRMMRNLKSVRMNIEKLNEKIVPGYKYTGSVYREIGMQNSNFGGMENVGNTTITMNRLIPHKSMTDSAFEYMAAVKVHEYYHNLNGSEVTGTSPFEIWLNEAVTVCVEEDFMSCFFGEDYIKLKNFISINTPISGALALDRGTSSMPIIPPGFNDPDDLITSVVYVKSPKIVRMIEHLVGKENFVRALDNYHRKYAHSNASTKDWLFEMSHISGIDIEKISDNWLYKSGYPIITISKRYDPENKVMDLTVSQIPSNKTYYKTFDKTYNKTYAKTNDTTDTEDSNAPVWTFPLTYAFYDRKGKVLHENSVLINEPVTKITIENLEKPSFSSFDKDGIIFGEIISGSDKKELYLQVRKDKNIVSRFRSFVEITIEEFSNIFTGASKAPSFEYCSLYHDLLCDQSLMQDTGALFLTVFENAGTKEKSSDFSNYKKLYETRRTIYKSIADTFKNSLLILYNDYSEISSSTEEDDKLYTKNTYLSYRSFKIKSRMVKNHVLSILSVLDTPDVWDIIRNQILNSNNATDENKAFFAWLNCSAPDKSDVFKKFMEKSKQNPVSYESFLSAVSSSYSKDTIDLIQLIEKDSSFKIEQSNDQRALYVNFARNRKLSIQTASGLDFLANSIIKLATVNEYNTVEMLNAFSSIDSMSRIDYLSLMHTLVHIYTNIEHDKCPAVSNRIKKIVAASPKAYREYERSTGVSLSDIFDLS